MGFLDIASIDRSLFVVIGHQPRIQSLLPEITNNASSEESIVISDIKTPMLSAIRGQTDKSEYI